jgi:hypothetical protein
MSQDTFIKDLKSNAYNEKQVLPWVMYRAQSKIDHFRRNKRCLV